VTGRELVLDRLATMPGIDLTGLQATAELARRSDRKYVLDWETFATLVERLGVDHRVLDIGGRRTFAYDTVYFDSEELATFHAHVRGGRRRFKVRIRHYRDEGSCALEVKLKGRRGETIKHRLPYRPDDRDRLTADAATFLSDCLRGAYGQEPPAGLRPVLRTHYRRATLVAADGEERLTCDFDLSYPVAGAPGPALSVGHVIVETKSRDGRGRGDRVLRELQQRPVACSKYLLGVGLLGLRPVPNDLRRLAGRYFDPPRTTLAHHG
jgi:hypothetical protein